MDYEIDASLSSGNVVDVSASLSSAYKATTTIEDKLDDLESAINDAIPDKLDICNMGDTIASLTKIQSILADIVSSLASGITDSLTKGLDINIDASVDASIGVSTNSVQIPVEMLQYLSTGIIMKKYQILKYRIEKIKLVVERMALEETEKVFVWVLAGKGSLLTAPIDAALAALSTVASLISVLLNILGLILTVLSNISIINVKGAGCMFFLTPKSMSSKDITVMNVNQSTTNNIPQPVDIAISEASMIIDQANKVSIDAGVAAMSAAGAATAATGLDLGEFPKLPKFDPQKVRDAINLLLQLLLDADALPRYEKLSILNPRFMVFLITGFEPAAYQTFGIPGQP